MNRIATVAVLIVALAGVAAAPPRAAAADAAPTPTSLNVFVPSGFRYQDPNPYACTSTSAMDVLNFIALAGTGGAGFHWTPTLSYKVRDSILAWERTHDTLAGGYGSDPHGLRNALNFFGWGNAAVWQGYRVYDDASFSTYDTAVKSIVRAIARTHKPAILLAWAGRHVQMVTGYYGLTGDPFARDSMGLYANTFTVEGLYLSDPLYSQAWVNKPISSTALNTTTNLKMRFRRYWETDSPYDDPYTPGIRRAKDEWYGRWVTVLPMR
jgi:hypothetical protein